jgi:catechol 2,3-dioxygenase-like lactoylglutathione lyase family enzyme
MIPKAAQKIGALVFYVRDVQKSAAFYRDALGIDVQLSTVRYDADHPEEKMMRARLGDVSLIFFENGDAVKQVGKSPVVVFTLADGGIDAIVERLDRGGVQVVVPVSEAPGGWTADFLDPDGHVLSFYQSADKPR